jgi:hypothetical protein
MSDEHGLDRALRALAAATDEDAAPALETRLRAAFRALPSEVMPEPAPAPRVWLASLAAAAGVVWMVLAGGVPEVVPVAPPPAPAASVERAPVPAATVAPVRAAAARPATRRRAPRAEPAPFQALYPGDPLADLDAVHVVRVSVPRSSLFALGLESRAGTPDDAVEMDAMVGPDGVARAVRFVTAAR